MRFRIDFSRPQMSEGTLIYRPEEYSFDVVPTPKGFTSVLLNDLSLELNEEGKVVSVWGFCPHPGWISAKLTPPDAASGDMYFLSDTPLIRGVSIGLNRSDHLPVLVDRDLGWISIQTPDRPACSVRPLSAVILEIDEHDQLCAVWLKPERGLDEKAMPPKR